jgi:cell division septal protein FtsQ
MMIRRKKGLNKKKISRKERITKILKKGILALSASAALAFVFVLYRTISDLEIFKVREIEIKGNHSLSEEDLLNITDIKRDNIIKIDIEDLRTKILKSPWVKEATVRREFPGRISIQLAERVPMAIIDYGDSFYLVDGEGVIIARTRDREGYLLPLISGIDLSESRIGERSTSKGVPEGLTLLRFLKDNGLGLGDIEIVAKEPEDLTLNLAGKQIKIGSGNYQEKFIRLNEIEKELERRGILASSIDLRFSGKVIVVPMADGSL